MVCREGEIRKETGGSERRVCRGMVRRDGEEVVEGSDDENREKEGEVRGGSVEGER